MICTISILLIFFIMIRRPPRSTRTDTLFPYTTLVFSLLHGFDSHEPIRRVEIAEILLIFDYIFADHLAGFVSVISASPKGLDKPCNRPVSEHIGQNLRPLLRISEARRVGKERVSRCRSRWSPGL